MIRQCRALLAVASLQPNSVLSASAGAGGCVGGLGHFIRELAGAFDGFFGNGMFGGEIGCGVELWVILTYSFFAGIVAATRLLRTVIQPPQRQLERVRRKVAPPQLVCVHPVHDSLTVGKLPLDGLKLQAVLRADGESVVAVDQDPAPSDEWIPSRCHDLDLDPVPVRVARDAMIPCCVRGAAGRLKTAPSEAQGVCL